MNTVSGNASSVASLATSVFGSAREVFKAITDAAVNPQPDAAGTPQPAKSARRGTLLDRYI